MVWMGVDPIIPTYTRIFSRRVIATQTIQKIHLTFGDDAMGKTQIRERYNRFQHDLTSLKSEARLGMSSTSRNEKTIEKVR